MTDEKRDQRTPPQEEIVEGYALRFGEVDGKGVLITPDAFKNFDLELLRNRFVDLRLDQTGPVGIIKDAEVREEGLYIRVRVAPGIVFPAKLGDFSIGAKGLIKKSHMEGDVKVVEEMELTGLPVIEKDAKP